jgi:hypothetical protein
MAFFILSIKNQAFSFISRYTFSYIAFQSKEIFFIKEYWQASKLLFSD